MKIELKQSLAPFEAPPVHETGYIVWDAGWTHEGSRLGCRILPSGVRSLIVKCRVGKKQTTITLGRLDVLKKKMTIQQIRSVALDKVADAKGAGLTAVQMADRDTRNNVDIATIGEEYIQKRMQGSKPYKDGGAAVRKAIDRAAKVWGMTPVARLRVEDGEELMRHVIETAQSGKDRRDRGRLAKDSIHVHKRNPGHAAAQKARALLKPVLRYANNAIDPDVKVGIMDHFTLKTNGPKEVVLSSEQVDAFFEAVGVFERTRPNRTGGRSMEERADTAALLRLQYACAARPQDWLQAQWVDVGLDDEKPFVRFAEHKRKQGKDFRQRLLPNIVAILREIQGRRRSTEPEDYIFPSRQSSTGHRVSIGSAFETIVKMADLDHIEGLSPHVLRASRITELKDRYGWSFQKVATFMGNTPEVVEKAYYRPRWEGQDLELDDLDEEGRF